MNFLHNFLPNATLLEVGPITIYWYGFFIALAILAGLLVSLQIAKWYKIEKNVIFDLFFYLIIGGLIGTRVFYILYNPIYFWQHPLDIFKIWQGGLAIHGGLLFGLLILIWFCKKRKVDFWKLTSVIVPGIVLGQAIGRWGNYFNQELFGLPTDLAWGIPIAMANRPVGYEMFEYFHPTFLYESIGSLVIFGILLLGHWFVLKRSKILDIRYWIFITVGYILLYSILRFFMEFLRIDEMLVIFGMRVTLLVSLVIIVGCIGFIAIHYRVKT